MQPSHQTWAAVVGRESLENLRLADLLRELIGRECVSRHLETEHLVTFLDEHAEIPLVVFLDIFSFEVPRVTAVIDEVRMRHPRVVFSLYVDPDDWQRRRGDFPGEWFDRLGHYYHLYKVPSDQEYDPIVRQAFKEASWEAQYNLGHEPIRITQNFDAGVLPPDSSHEDRPIGEQTVFVSYSRTDWERLVSALAQRLRRDGFRLWVDQGFLLGGDDWMDAVGEALQTCGVCLLAISPDAMQSRYVKMEYRFFFTYDKPIVPVLVRPVAKLPFELTGIQYVDFTTEGTSQYDELHKALARSAEALNRNGKE